LHSAIPATPRPSVTSATWSMTPTPACASRSRWRLGEFDGPESAASLVKLLVDLNALLRQRRPTAWPNWKDPACADAILPLVQHGHAFVRMGALRALKELRRKDTLKPALEALKGWRRGGSRPGDRSHRVSEAGRIHSGLTASTGDSDAHVRRAAVSALAFSQMKPAAESIRER